MEGVVFILIIIVGLIVVLPIVAMVKASQASRKAETFEIRLRALEQNFADLQAGRIPPSKASAPIATPPPLPSVPSAPFIPSPPPALQTAPQVTEAPKSWEALPVPPPLRPPINWEQFMGAKLFAWVGGLALFLGVAFFIKYSFDRNLIPPELRVALGFATGIGLLVGGFVMDKKKYKTTSHTLCATGVLILYAVTFACRAVYHFDFFGVVPTFLLMALVTAVAFLLAVRLNARVVAVLGLLGGFLTPVLLSTGRDQPVGLFGYVGLLVAGLLAVALVKRWHFLAVLGAVGTVLMEWGWFGEFFTIQKAPIALAVFDGFAVFMLLAVLAAWRCGQLNDWFVGAAAGLAASAFGFAIVMLNHGELARSPLMFLTATFVPGICLLALSLVQPHRPQFHLAGMLATFFLLAAWTSRRFDGDLLRWALGSYFLFTMLHSAFPLVWRRLHPGLSPPRWIHAIPLLALVLVLVPLNSLDVTSLLIWPVVLLIDVVVIGAAILAGALWIIMGALALTLLALACWIGQVSATDLDSLPALVVTVGGFALAFFGLTWALRKKFATLAASGGDGEAWEKPLEALTPHLPAMSAALPFLLLMLTAARLPLTDPSPVFGLALVLAALLLGLARLLPNGVLPLVGLLSVALLEHVWQGAHLWAALDAHSGFLPLAWHITFCAVFAAFPFVFRRQFSDQLLPWVASALAGPLHFYLVHRLVGAAWPNDFMGVVPALFALPSLAALVVVVKKLPEAAGQRPAQLAWFGAVALFFITLIVPIQFSREWITLGWAFEGTALLWFFHRVPHPGLRLTGLVLLCVVFARLALNPMVLSYHARSGQPLLNWYLYTYGLAALCCFGGAWLLRPPRNQVCGRPAPPLLWAFGTVLAFLLVNIEIADFFTDPGRPVLTFEFSGNFARDMAYTVAWAIFAFLLLVLGLGRRLRAVRHAGIGLLAIALLKLFLHDLSALPSLYRVGALLITALIAIVASFLYQKLASPIQDDESTTSPPAPPPDA